jgi:acyl-CoA-binding protein
MYQLVELYHIFKRGKIMIVHIVMFTFKEENKAHNIQKVKAALEALPQKIACLKSLEVGVNFTQSPRAMDLSLYATFQTKEDLEAYAVDAAHLEVVALIKEVTVESKVVDYTL